MPNTLALLSTNIKLLMTLSHLNYTHAVLSHLKDSPTHKGTTNLSSFHFTLFKHQLNQGTSFNSSHVMQQFLARLR